MSYTLVPPHATVPFLRTALRHTLESEDRKNPYCSGTCRVPPENFHVYYRHAARKESGFLDMFNASEQDVQPLLRACRPLASSNSVHSGELGSDCFAVGFSPERQGFLDMISAELLEGLDEERQARLELRQLNVYGREHARHQCNDPSKEDDLFGRLLCVYPTAHEGGTLVLHNEHRQYRINPKDLLSETAEPNLAYIAFYSDLEYEVEPVTSGHLVMLAYDIRFIKRDESNKQKTHLKMSTTTVNQDEVKGYLNLLLDNSEFLPKGGLIGFGLCHKYPVEFLGRRNYRTDPTPMRSVGRARRRLKGPDAVLMRAAKDLGLHAFLRVIYYDLDKHISVMSDGYAVFLNTLKKHPLYELVDDNDERKADVVEHVGCGVPVARKPRKQGHRVARWTIDWITEVGSINTFVEPFIDASHELEFFHGNLALIVRIGPPGARAIATASGSVNEDSASERYSDLEDEDPYSSDSLPDASEGTGNSEDEQNDQLGSNTGPAR
ncbi:hypothetical protein OE88DRAFT_1669022 [Heliocybe sulcata]|uniref:Prolyl 4-hydroxylase alpha subunit Fe(2+) 2OG dioxygenase domain-containing protein n=1 Tax=Heliocybe sulcata TaxID=5364 RepID=A0A5C3MW06_9AGAM|nr:hypothetical protein OE88DRAFT_1669022 [Heliocybe sulcata]